MKQYERSLEGYDKLIELNPNEIRAYLYRGLCRYRCGKHKPAEQDFDKVINFDDDVGVESGGLLEGWKYLTNLKMVIHTMLKNPPKSISEDEKRLLNKYLLVLKKLSPDLSGIEPNFKGLN